MVIYLKTVGLRPFNELIDISFSCDCCLQDMGTVILGKLESGSISKAQQLIMMPNRVKFCLVLLCPIKCPEVREKRRKGVFFFSSFG